MAFGTVLLVLLMAASHWHTASHSRNSDERIVVYSQILHSSSPIDGYTETNHHLTPPPFYADFKEPDTPPSSLPSDPYAQYIYQQELDLARRPLFMGARQPRKPRRTIVVGDVHGSLDGLNRFLSSVHFDTKRDLLVLAGDLIAKGPQSLEVIDRARQLNAKCVRGNHEDKIIRWRGYLDSLSKTDREALIAENEDEDEPEYDQEDDQEDEIFLVETLFNNGSSLDDSMQRQRKRKSRKPKVPSDLNQRSEHYTIARALTKDQYDYIRSCPLILTIPRELSVRNIPVHIVHAGIDPTHTIRKQHPWVLVNIRNVLEDGTPSRKKSQGEGWSKAFNDLHDKRSKRDFLVVYGHDAGRSLNVRRWSIGLDTGCVYGRELTGYVIETGDIHSVPCPRT
ncbi:hypothetical protein BGZ70_000129 [Mortierella alpina]|uniref:Calcineurin-like phosphoesterase domain-containing protein n=1 Tax=Mortierella alpina TaxID=64518 RepID=A0A9P6JEP9_MORAP|nr:hypothetical protein BGZ70_000129 [Mortierella alpina]